MDASQFDSLSKRVATPATRRATLGAMVASVFGLSSAPPVARAAPGQTCTMSFVAAVRLGPSVNATLVPGTTQPGQMQGKLTFALDENGKLENASLTLPDNTSLPVVGQATGNALQLRISIDGKVAVVAMGVGEAEIAECKGAVDGTTAGPQVGDLGEWHARGQGLTGQPTATGGGKKGGKGGGGGGQQGGSNGGGSKGGSKGGGQGGATGPTGPAGTPPKCATGQTVCGDVCVDLKTDAANCGTCGTKCKKKGTCVAGTCSDSAEQGVTCPAGQVNCGGKCVNLNNDQENCGACGTACGAQDCVNGVCGGTCPADRPDDCGDCVNTQTDPAHCGGCGVACAAGETCVAGVCGAGGPAACQAGQVDCGGTCTDLTADPSNCGLCGFTCAAGETCANGVCQGPAGGCLPGETDCDGVCTDVTTDIDNCGACGFACAADETCAGGICLGPEAPPPPDCVDLGLTDCGGACTDVTSDPSNCGACGTVCAADETCAAGICLGPELPPPPDCVDLGLTDCGGVCADLFNDSFNCGDCGIVCGDGTACFEGFCL